MKPGNLLVRIGTSFKACVDFCGGYMPGGPEKIVSGGPMMGVALYTDEVPVIAGTSGILALSGDEARLPEPAACMRCGRCHRVCPMNLQPYAIEDAILARDAAKAARFYAQQCIECGACGSAPRGGTWCRTCAWPRRWCAAARQARLNTNPK